MNMNKKTLGIGGLIIGLIILVVVVLPQDSDDSLISGLGTATGLGDNVDIIQSEILFLDQIQQLQSINLTNVSLLEDERFTRLVDNTVPIPDFNAGRVNPYAAIDARIRFQEQQRQQQQLQQIIGNQQTPTENTEATEPSIIPIDGLNQTVNLTGDESAGTTNSSGQ